MMLIPAFPGGTARGNQSIPSSLHCWSSCVLSISGSKNPSSSKLFLRPFSNHLFVSLSLLPAPYLVHPWFPEVQWPNVGTLLQLWGFSISEIGTTGNGSRKKLIILNQFFTKRSHFICHFPAFLLPPFLFPPSVGSSWSFSLSQLS